MKDHADEIKISTTHPLKSDGEQDEKITARWGEVFLEETATIQCKFPDLRTLQITIKTGETAILGRIRETTTNLIEEDAETIPVLEAGFRQQLIELALLDKEERERIEAIQAGNSPIINLEPYNGALLGVSRKHAVLEMGDKYITVTDLNSTNGTKLNGMKLTPYHRRVLRNGDEVILGNLAMKIIYIYPNAD